MSMRNVVVDPFSFEGPFPIPVHYDMPRERERLEGFFSDRYGVCPLFYSHSVYDWLLHPSRTKLVEDPCDKTFYMRECAGESDDEAIAHAAAYGYLPATHLEAFDFSRVLPELQTLHWIVAPGSFLSMGSDTKFVAALCLYGKKDRESRTITVDPYNRKNRPSGTRLLFVGS